MEKSGYSYLGDRGFSYVYLLGGLISLDSKTSDLALSSAMKEAPVDEISGDLYALDLRKEFRHSSTKLSTALENYFGSDQQQATKNRAYTEVNVHRSFGLGD